MFGLDFFALCQLHFQCRDFGPDVRFYTAGLHPALEHLVRFECGRNCVMRADEDAIDEIRNRDAPAEDE